MIVYSGEINEEGVNEVITGIVSAWSEREGDPGDVSLLLTTVGGDIHQAFRLITTLHAFFDDVDVVVFGRCKSAGTLVAIGATSVAMTLTGELGPLDVQIRKPDEIAQRSSGLETTNSLEVLYTDAFKAFEKYMLLLIRRSYTSISTATACRIASDLVSGIFSPIAAQIDPYKVAAVSRSVAVAEAYGQRLLQITNNLTPGSLNTLVRGYPDHAFVINVTEAKGLFDRVRDPSKDELEAYKQAVSEGHTDASTDPPHVKVIAPPEMRSHTSDEDQGDDHGTHDNDHAENKGGETEKDGGGVSSDSVPHAEHME
ncbi:MAG: ATP-dependent Clp protease proteolytic subunit [Spirochaetaceae bacterium]|nr:ATP-dependent Clp protease proteolytic subunit [Spirochaetaceae bacterium]